MGRAESASDGVVDKNRARRGDLAHDVECRANDQRGNALAFDNVSNETDRLVAKGSIGDEEGEIDFGLLHFLGESVAEIIFYLAVPPHAAHEG